MNGLALADSHRIEQVKLSQMVTALMAQAWSQTMARGTNGFPAFLALSEMLIGRGQGMSAAMAGRYYNQLAVMAGFDPIELAGGELNRAGLAKSLKTVGPDRVAEGLARGLPIEEAQRQAMIAAMGVGKRYTLDGGRNLLLEAADRDPHIERWARVSDGNPCSFCAMLVSRGAVYHSEETGGFKSHDFCGCGVRLVTADEDDGGADAQADKYKKLWDATNKDPHRFAAGLRLARGETKRSYLLDEDEVAAIAALMTEGLRF